MDANKTSYNPLDMNLTCQETPSKHTPLSSSLGLDIVEAFKLTLFVKIFIFKKKRFEFYLTTIDFDNFDVCEVKYLMSSFDSDIMFVLPLMTMRIPIVYGHSIHVMDKMCNGHPWCATKTTNIQNNFGFSLRPSSCVGHVQCQNDYCDYKHCNGSLAIVVSRLDQLSFNFLLEVWPLINRT